MLTKRRLIRTISHAGLLLSILFLSGCHFLGASGSINFAHNGYYGHDYGYSASVYSHQPHRYGHRHRRHSQSYGHHHRRRH